MKKKIVGMFVCMLLIALIIPVTGTYEEKTISPTRQIELVPVLDLTDIKGGLFEISVILTNSGEGTAGQISWEMTAVGGLFFYPESTTGTFDVLYPGQSEIIKILPVLGIGIPYISEPVTITFYCKYKMVNVSEYVDFEVKQEWRDLAFLLWHIFPETFQPKKEWMDIQEFWYFNKSAATSVGFYYEGINNMHNVRVMLGLPACSQEIPFLAACKFTNGTAILTECGVTEPLVMGGDAHWEIELVDGE